MICYFTFYIAYFHAGYHTLVQTRHEFRQNSILLKVGRTIRSTMLIINGLVKLYREDDEGKEFFIYHLDTGQACSLSMVCAAKHETSAFVILIGDAVLNYWVGWKKIIVQVAKDSEC